MNGRFISYLRVSTQRQGQSGLGLDAQRAAVENYLNGGRWKLVEEVIEVESGKNSDRPALIRALRLCRVHGATLVVAKLDRLARNVAFIANLMEAGVRFVAADMPEANETMLHFMSVMAQHEAKAISERTKAALARSKKKLGGVRWTVNSEGERVMWNIGVQAARASRVGVKVRREKAAKRAADLAPVIEDLRQQGAASLRAIAEGLNERGIQTAWGGQWSATQVQRIIQA